MRTAGRRQGDRSSRGAALVTGASRGIGRRVATQLGDLGYGVAVNYRAAAAEAEAVVAEIRAGGGTALHIQADVAVAGEAADMVEQAERSLGAVSIS